MPEKTIRYDRWRPLIEASRNEDALVAVMREYCDTLLPSDVAKLPARCPQCSVRSVTDIGELAVEYTAIELKYDRDDEARTTLHDLALTFCAAAEQLKRLRHPMLNIDT
ncbi:MAG: hypothetical protein ACM3SO_17960 [Betaproteobacteria bacterium]